MIRIALLIDTIDAPKGEAPTGGTERQLLHMIERIDRTRFAPVLCCLRDSRWLQEDYTATPLRVFHIHSLSKPATMKRLWDLAAFLRNEHIDVLHVHFKDSTIAGSLAAMLTPSVPLLAARKCMNYWMRDIDRLWNKAFGWRVTRYVTNATAVIDYSRKEEGIAPDRFTYIPNGIDIERFTDTTALNSNSNVQGGSHVHTGIYADVSAAEFTDNCADNCVCNGSDNGADNGAGSDTHDNTDKCAAIRQTKRQTVRQNIRQSLGITPEQTAVISVGGLRAVKRMDVVLKAASHLRTFHPEESQNIRFFIAGDGQRREELQALHQELGLNGLVTFLGRRSDIPEILSAMDIGLLTSRSEASSNAVIEYMASGLPVISTDVGGCREIVGDESCGILIGEQRLIPDIADAVLHFSQSAEDRLRTGRNGRRRAEKTFSMQAYVSSYEQLYTTLAARNGGAR